MTTTSGCVWRLYYDGIGLPDRIFINQTRNTKCHIHDWPRLRLLSFIELTDEWSRDEKMEAAPPINPQRKQP